MKNSRIEWTDHTFNPWIGCTKVSPGCDHCYAERLMDHRMHKVSWNGARVRTSSSYWRQPLRWDKDAAASGTRPRVFCASLADIFDGHPSITSGWVGDLWHLIHSTPHLDWLLLTKRPQNIAHMLPESYGMPAWGYGWDNVWLGTSIENQGTANLRSVELRIIPARHRFISCEPLLGPVEIHLDGRLHWVIAGGESGPQARPLHPDWARSLRDQCVYSGTPFFFKQWGEWAPWDDDNWSLPAGADDVIAHDHAITLDGVEFLRVGKKRAGRCLDGLTWSQLPAEMRKSTP
jgi:protein gp37